LEDERLGFLKRGEERKQMEKFYLKAIKEVNSESID